MKCSIYHKNCSHTAELEQLLSKHPQPANHDQAHYVFVSEYVGEDRTSTPIDVDELGLAGDELAWAVAKVITVDTEAVLHLNVHTADRLHRHPAWRIWCANYKDRSLFESDWAYIKDMVERLRPEASSSWPAYSESMTYEQGRDIIHTAISTNS